MMYRASPGGLSLSIQREEHQKNGMKLERNTNQTAQIGDMPNGPISTFPIHR